MRGEGRRRGDDYRGERDEEGAEEYSLG